MACKQKNQIKNMLKKETISWDSKKLGRKMELAVYGHYGISILLFPATTDSCLENEENGMIQAIQPLLESGRFKVFSLGAMNFESWLTKDEKTNEEKSEMHKKYNQYIIEEVLPFIFGECGCEVPIITAGAAIGAYHAANTFFRRPDIFLGTIAMSGTFDITHYTNGFLDEKDNCYFNSPIHFLPKLKDNYWLSFLKSRKHIYLLSGKGENEYPENSEKLAGILSDKQIKHTLDIWGEECGHNYSTWNLMLNKVLVNYL